MADNTPRRINLRLSVAVDKEARDLIDTGAPRGKVVEMLENKANAALSGKVQSEWLHETYGIPLEPAADYPKETD